MASKSREELMAIARIEPKVPFKKKKLLEIDVVKDFIDDEKLVANDKIPIPAFLIYMRYVNWCKQHDITPKGVSYFFARFKLHFNSRLIKQVRHYYLEPTGFDLSPASLEQANRDYKKKTSDKKAQTKDTSK